MPASKTSDLIKLRRAEVEDTRDFNALITTLGGPTLFRAWFGQFHYGSLIEYSFYSLVADFGSETCVGFMSLNDSISSVELHAFDSVLECLTPYINCKVNLIEMLTYHGTITYSNGNSPQIRCS